MKWWYRACLFALLCSACTSTSDGGKSEGLGEKVALSIPVSDYHQAIGTLTKSITEDILSPPVAGRVYAYASLAAWEAYSGSSANASPLLPLLSGSTESVPPARKEVAAPVAAMAAFFQTAKALVFTESYLQDLETRWVAGLPEGLTTTASLAYGREVSRQILAYASGDGYAQTRTFPKHPGPENDGDWVPTPPLFMGGLEPHWNRIRPFTLDSADQFIPEATLAFNRDPGSEFFALVREVYTISANLTEEQESIARFWDCNPYVTEEQAHLMPGLKKLTPGGHWMAIAGIAARNSKSDWPTTLRAYCSTAIALHDAFISCWDEKYRSNLIRPETVINRYIDDRWKPLLETPPFPEYTSGHSVISSSASVVLTGLFGEPFPFVDSTEVEFGLPPRQFRSFREASFEASQSRIYGGIHYRPAVEIGVDQGRKVGEHVWSRLQSIVPADQTAQATNP